MEAFETTITGSDGQINGIVTPVKFPGAKQAYQFVSLDDALHLTIALETNNTWIRIAGTTPYFPGWVEELAEKVLSNLSDAKNNADTSPKKTSSATAKKPITKVTPVKAERAVTIKTTKSEPAKAASATAKSKPTVKKTAVKAEPVKKTKPAIAASKKGKVTSATTKK